jgi:hypothetical protein
VKRPKEDVMRGVDYQQTQENQNANKKYKEFRVFVVSLFLISRVFILMQK